MNISSCLEVFRSNLILRLFSVGAACLCMAVTVPAQTPPPTGKFAAFESGHVRPMALSPSGLQLYVVNTPDARLEVFDVSSAVPRLTESIPVGLEPVAVAVAPDGKVWVVNHLSDSVSIVDVSIKPARVINTLYVGDEPRDILFAGANSKWAFITAAHRGQNINFDPKLRSAGVGRADVWVFDALTPGGALGGKPVTVLNMFGDTLRALAKNNSGTWVYAAVFNSGNRSTVLDDIGYDIYYTGLAKPSPGTEPNGKVAPRTPLIVQKNAAGNWVDGGNPKAGIAPRNWNARVKLDLPDNDVFAIDASGSIPTVSGSVPGVGTTLFNMAVNPLSEKLYVSNQEARNLIRFEGEGTRSTTLRGRFIDSRITVIGSFTEVGIRDLNKHITSYDQPVGTPAERDAALAIPLGMTFSADGHNLYLAAMGSDKVAKFATAELDANTFVPSPTKHLQVRGGGPTDVILDPVRNKLFVTTRYDNGLSVIDASSWTEIAHVTMANPEPADLVAGRRFLYDARLSSSRGNASCAGCHIFGDMDQLSWDLGHPEGLSKTVPNAYNSTTLSYRAHDTWAAYAPYYEGYGLSPMKGPMSTQSLKGMTGNGPLHWRGDKTGTVNRKPGETLEESAFREFNGAYTSLLGRNSPLSDAEMTAFSKFAMYLMYPPNPVAPLDGSWTVAQAEGRRSYFSDTTTTSGTCNACHTLDVAKGKFGTDGLMAFVGLTEDFKNPHLRNMYQKVGMFAHNTDRHISQYSPNPIRPHVGPQIRGFGFDRSGVHGTLFQFFQSFNFFMTDAQRNASEEFMLAFPSDVSQVVGQQLTLTPANYKSPEVVGRYNLLLLRAAVTSPRVECELVAKGVLSGVAKGWVLSQGNFISDRTTDPAVKAADMINLVAASPSDPRNTITLTCAPPGNGTRLGISRAGKTTRDRD